MPLVVALVLAVALVLRLGVAVISWPAETPSAQPAQVQQSGQNLHAVDLAAVQSLKLFSSSNGAQAGPLATKGKVDTTDLDLGLEGVVLASDPNNSRAFIISNGQQHSYKSGDTLPVSAGVSLAVIAQDHVLIRNNGIEQALWLYEAGGKAKTAKAVAVAKPDRSPGSSAVTVNSTSAATASLQTAPQQIRKVSARLAEIIEVAPAAANGQLLGYKLSPGHRLKDFVQLGFKSNDIVTSVNGIALNDMANLPELYSLMNKPGDVSFSILREGQPLALQMTMAP